VGPSEHGRVSYRRCFANRDTLWKVQYAGTVQAFWPGRRGFFVFASNNFDNTFIGSPSLERRVVQVCPLAAQLLDLGADCFLLEAFAR
jgi:hypothetical protein